MMVSFLVLGLVWLMGGKEVMAVANLPFGVEFGKTELVDTAATHTCETATGGYDYYDNTTRVLVKADGSVMYYGTDDNNRYATGNNLNEFSHKCGKVMVSDYQPNPDQFNDAEYLHGFYTEDGNTVYGLIHNEYHGWTHNNCNCGPADYSCWLNCYWYTTNLAVSTDSGLHFTHAVPPNQNIVHSAIPYSPEIGTITKNFGFSSPSNIIKKDGLYYAMVGAYTTTSPFDGSICLMRTNNLANPLSWLFWDGTGFTIPAGAQGGSKPRCAALTSRPASSANLTYNSYLNKYLTIGNDMGGDTPTQPEAHMSISDTLTTWSEKYLFSGVDDSQFYAFGTLFQPGDETRNFEQTARSPWFYYVTCADGVRTNGCVDEAHVASGRTKLMRTRVRFSKPEDVGKYELLDLKFSERKGTKTLDSGFYGNDGTLSGDAQLQRVGNDYLVNFNGNGVISIPHEEHLSVSGKITIAFTIRTSMRPETNQFPVIIANTNATKRNYGVYLTANGLVHFSVMNGTAFAGSMSKKAINDGNWHTVYINFEDDSGKATYWIDGVADTEVVQGGKLADGISADSTVRIGPDGLAGDINNITIFNYRKCPENFGSACVMPSATPTPVCKTCPTDFGCYYNQTTNEYKWLVAGYVPGGFVVYTTSNCGGVVKPTYLGKSAGDANCDGIINGVDYSVWRKEYLDISQTQPIIRSTWEADFTGVSGKCDGIVNGYDYSIWRRGYRGI